MAYKRQHGQFFTSGNPFGSECFYEWAQSINANIAKTTVLEPFAGENSLIEHLERMNLCYDFKSFDLYPANRRVEKCDTLLNFPSGYSVCVTNPPWLAKNSATARGLPFPAMEYDDLYKFALEKCLANCEWVAALVPESFIRANLFHDRLWHFVSLTEKIFADTSHPVGLALFRPEPCEDVIVWRDDKESDTKKLGTLAELMHHLPKPQPDGVPVRFNDPEGNVGLIAVDNTSERSIRFCDPRELAGYEIKHSSRAITKIAVEGRVRLDDWNDYLWKLRDKTCDVLLTSFKGMRKDGFYRRRLDWYQAKGIIHSGGQRDGSSLL